VIAQQSYRNGFSLSISNIEAFDGPGWKGMRATVYQIDIEEPHEQMQRFLIAALPCALASRIARAFRLCNPFFYSAVGVIVSLLTQLALGAIMTWSPIQWYTDEQQPFTDQLRGIWDSLWTVGPVFCLAGVLAAITFWALAGRHYSAQPNDQSK
jgi:hypothetical protein